MRKQGRMSSHVITLFPMVSCRLMNTSNLVYFCSICHLFSIPGVPIKMQQFDKAFNNDLLFNCRNTFRFQEGTHKLKLQLHYAIYRLRFYSNSLIHILSLSNSHNNVASVQNNRADKSHRVTVALDFDTFGFPICKIFF